MTTNDEMTTNQSMTIPDPVAEAFRKAAKDLDRQTKRDWILETFRKAAEDLDRQTERERKQWRKFQNQAEARAQTLEAEAMATRLVALAEDPHDVMCFLFDLSAYTMNAKAQQLARLKGNPLPPPAYVPVSRLLTRFGQLLADKMAAVPLLLDVIEQERVKRIVPGFMNALEANDPLVQSIVLQLISMTSEETASWIRQNLERIELRFAS